MKSIVYRDNKAFLIASIAYTGSVSFFALVLTFIAVNNETPWWFWLMFSLIECGLVSLLCLFTFFLVTYKAVISDHSLKRISFRKEQEILKEEILLIADTTIGKGSKYVVYPKGYDKELIKTHYSPYIDIITKAKTITRDKQLLIFTKTKRFTEILDQFGYSSKVKHIE